jgi:hypothetical protein
MKTVDGQHRTGHEDHSDWCRNLFDSLADNGVWGVPRNGLTFQRRGQRLVLIKRASGFDTSYQENEYQLTKRQFAIADIEVTEDINE